VYSGAPLLTKAIINSPKSAEADASVIPVKDKVDGIVHDRGRFLIHRAQPHTNTAGAMK